MNCQPQLISVGGNADKSEIFGLLDLFAKQEAAHAERAATAMVERQAHAALMQDPPAAAGHALAGYAVTALRRAGSWALYHSGRASARGLREGEEAFTQLAETFDRLATVTEARGLRPALKWVPAAAYQKAFHVTDHQTGGWHQDAALDQLIEVEESLIRALCDAVHDICDQHWQMSQGFMSPLEAVISAAAALLNAPPSPPQGVGL